MNPTKKKYLTFIFKIRNQFIVDMRLNYVFSLQETSLMKEDLEKEGKNISKTPMIIYTSRSTSHAVKYEQNACETT